MTRWNLPIAPAIAPSTFRRQLHAAAASYLTGPVTDLFPHLLRHACATHNSERGMPLWEVNAFWATTGPPRLFGTWRLHKPTPSIPMWQRARGRPSAW
jgi:integrase